MWNYQEIDREYESGQACAVEVSGKTAREIYLSVGRKVIEINEELPDLPELINESPYE